jgi:hypothetical protein
MLELDPSFRMCLWTMGYGRWPAPVRAERMVAALLGHGVSRLVDVRLSPCASNLEPGRYGPKPWTLQSGRDGIVGLLQAEFIAYEWIVELGNPQRQDRRMTVLRKHLADPRGHWPVHRGLDRLAALVRGADRVAILCACADPRACHRTVIARALSERAFQGRLTIRDIRGPG